MMVTNGVDMYLFAADLGETEDPRLLTKVQPVTGQVHLQVQPLPLLCNQLLLLALFPATVSSSVESNGGYHAEL